MPFHTHRLANGLQIVAEQTPSARSVALGFFVNTGARDEAADESGVSHFLEHMMFKGTARRTALEVNLHMDRIGASTNAYTSEEATVFYAAVLPEYLPQALDILADILRPSLREEDFVTEKQVILEEISQYDDRPTFLASDHARRIYFGTHPLGNTILGTRASITALTREQMNAYFERRYAAPNLVLAAAGAFDWPAFVAMVEEKCGHWAGDPVGRDHLHEVSGAGGLHVVAKPGIVQEHVMAMSPGPAVDSPLRYAAAVLAVAIGDDSGSRFYWELIDPGVVESASCGTDPNHGTGTLVSSYSCEPEQASENLAIVRRILADVQDKNITADELATAKSKIASRVVRRSERPMGRMQLVAGAWIYNREHHDIDRELARFDAVSLDSIRECLTRYPIAEPTVVAFGPLVSLA